MNREFKSDIKDGEGSLQYGDGSLYIGAFRADKRHGPGSLSSPDGRSMVQGVFANDLLHGPGTLIFLRSADNVELDPPEYCSGYVLMYIDRYRCS